MHIRRSLPSTGWYAVLALAVVAALGAATVVGAGLSLWRGTSAQRAIGLPAQPLLRPGSEIITVPAHHAHRSKPPTQVLGVQHRRVSPPGAPAAVTTVTPRGARGHPAPPHRPRASQPPTSVPPVSVPPVSVPPVSVPPVSVPPVSVPPVSVPPVSVPPVSVPPPWANHVAAHGWSRASVVLLRVRPPGLAARLLPTSASPEPDHWKPAGPEQWKPKHCKPEHSKPEHSKPEDYKPEHSKPGDWKHHGD